ncbi:MAG TPA: hypothetical protein VMK12_03875 [Anaeromyxobacteraceae bacterium]|nr:hypothetical protein [Anaeromyxobacteraceae bacterium]
MVFPSSRILRFETLRVHAEQKSPFPNQRAPSPSVRQPPFNEHDARLFALKDRENTRTRIMHPTTDVFVKRRAAHGGGTVALATWSRFLAIPNSLKWAMTSTRDNPAVQGGEGMACMPRDAFGAPASPKSC